MQATGLDPYPPCYIATLDLSGPSPAPLPIVQQAGLITGPPFEGTCHQTSYNLVVLKYLHVLSILCLHGTLLGSRGVPKLISTIKL